MPEPDLVVVAPPARVERVARFPGDPFAPPPWAIALPNGTFGNRFDDPGAGPGQPLEERFRTISCATQRAAAFGETIARFRPSLALLAQLAELEGGPGSFDPTALGITAVAGQTAGTVPAEWWARRQVAATRLAPDLRFVDIAAAEALTHLRRALAPIADRLGIADIDLAAVTGPQRAFTQACARYLHEQRDELGAPRFAGIRYGSRLHRGWECWAVFADRLRHQPEPPTRVEPGDPDLREAARVLGLVVEEHRSG